MDACTRMAESFCCSPETITMFLIGYTTIQNKKFKNKELFFKQKKKDLICKQGEDDMGGSWGKNMTCGSRSLDLIPSVATVKNH